MGKLDNKILCIKSDILFQKEKWNGLNTKDQEYYYNLLLKESEFRVRGELEEDPSYKQIIPQIVVRHKDKYFLHEQTNGTEGRLNTLHPLFLGGHVEEFDLEKGKDLIQTALEREIDEEVYLKAEIVARKYIGLIYLEDENPVNHVHVGIAYIFDVDSEDVHIKEDEELTEVGFVDINYLKTNVNKLTFWSRLLVNDYL